MCIHLTEMLAGYKGVVPPSYTVLLLTQNQPLAWRGHRWAIKVPHISRVLLSGGMNPSLIYTCMLIITWTK